MGFTDWAKGLTAKVADYFSTAPPKPSHTRAIHATSFDQRDYERMVSEVPSVAKAVQELGRRVDYIDDFAPDLHAIFNRVSPVVHETEEMVPTHVANRDVLAGLLDLPEVQNLRQHTVNNRYSTAMAMLHVKESVLGSVEKAREAAEEKARQQAEAQDKLGDLEQRIQELKEALESTQDEGEEAQDWPLWGALEAMEGEVAQAQAAAAAAGQATQQAAHEAAAGMVKAVRAAVKEADDALNEEEALMAAFGVDDGELKKMSVEERLQLAESLRNNRLADFVKLIGAFKNVQQARSRRRVTKAASERHGTTKSNHIERMMPSEHLALGHPTTRLLQMARFAEHQLDTWDVRGKEKLGQGPIVCVVDESGSMDSALGGATREAWSKGLVLAMLDQAKRRKRDLIYIGFSSERQQFVVRFPNGESTIPEVIAMTEHFWDGGTNFETPLRMALEMIEEEYDRSAKGKPDIVFITDDEYPKGVSTDFLKEFHRVKAKAQVFVYGIAVGVGVGNSLAAVSDNVRSITDLVAAPSEVGDLFQTI